MTRYKVVFFTETQQTEVIEAEYYTVFENTGTLTFFGNDHDAIATFASGRWLYVALTV